MMEWKKIGKAILYPPIALMLLLLPVSAGLLVYSMVFLGTGTALAIISYVISAYTLTVWCFRLPYLLRLLKTFRSENKYMRIWREDERLRVNTTLLLTLVWNIGYGAFQLWLGIYHRTFWYCSFAVYYFLLGVARYLLVRYTRAHRAREKMREELLKYRATGWFLLVMNLALAVIVFFMIYWNRTFIHHEIITIAMAAYTFTSFTLAIINIVKYRKYESPIYSATKALSLAAACVSLLTLESTMLTTFSDGTMDAFSEKLLLGLTGGAIVTFIVAMALYIIIESNKKLKTQE